MAAEAEGVEGVAVAAVAAEVAEGEVAGGVVVLSGSPLIAVNKGQRQEKRACGKGGSFYMYIVAPRRAEGPRAARPRCRASLSGVRLGQRARAPTLGAQ